MKIQNYIYWQDDLMFLGYLEDYPDYWTQGKTIEELEENLVDIYKNLRVVPHPRITLIHTSHPNSLAAQSSASCTTSSGNLRLRARCPFCARMVDCLAS